MKNVDLLLSAQWVLPIAPKNIVLEQHTLVIKDGKIAALLPTHNAENTYTATEHLHFNNQVLMPGLINAHTHTPMSLFRGLADDLTLMDWLQKHIWPAEADIISENSVYTGSYLAITEMLRTGTTCFNDHYMFPQITAEVVKQVGIRACLGLQIMDIPTKWAESGKHALKKGISIYQNASRHQLLSWAWAPHSPYTVTDETFKELIEINQELDLPIHIHLHESADEINESMEQYNKRPIERLNDLSLLSSKMIAVHMTQIANSDLEIARATGMHIVHCPESNLKLASGFAPITTMLANEINVALGTDGAASNNDLDMFGEMKTAALLAKAQAQDPAAIPAHQALEMATINGARALALDDIIGSLEVGKAADIITVDLAPYFTQPIYNPISHLVYAINSLQTSNVWINGKRLMNDNKLIHIDTDLLLKQTKEWVTKAQPYRN